MQHDYQKRTYDSWQEVDTETLFQGLVLIKEKFLQIDPQTDDFALTGNLLIDIYEIAEELEKRLLFV